MKNKFNLLVISLVFASLVARAQQPDPPPPPSLDARLQHVSSKLQKELTLTTTQKQKVETAYKNFFTQMEKLRGTMPPPPPPPGKKEEVEKLAQLRDAEIKKVLTAEQFKKYVDVEKTLRPPPPPGPPKEPAK